MNPPIDRISLVLGSDLGIWQLTICILIFLCKFPSAWVQLSYLFLYPKQESYCIEPEGVTDACSKDCQKVDYNRTIFETTVTSDFELICNRRILISVAQVAIIIGIMMGSIYFGIYADKYGRKITFFASCILQMISGVLVSFSPNFVIFIILRFLYAFATGGQMVISFVIVMELIGPEYRETLALLYQIPFNIGHASLPIFSYFIRQWRWYHLSFSAFTVTYLMYFFVISESPRWLLSTGELDKAVEILKKGAKHNGAPTETIRAELETTQQNMSEENDLKKGILLDLFKTPVLRTHTLLIAFIFFTICMAYFGVVRVIADVSRNIFLNSVIGGLMGIPGIIVGIPLTRYWGRRSTMILSNILTGTLALFPLVPSSLHVPLAYFGLFGAAMSFPNAYLISAEIFPTVVRSSGIGLCLFVGHFGMGIAPLITYFEAHHQFLPSSIFGIFSLFSAYGTLFLPETMDAKFPETLADGEKLLWYKLRK